MASPYMSQIIMFGGNFAPKNYALCNGTLMPINQYQAIFSLLGTTFGGDGIRTFQLPNLQGRTAVGVGNGTGWGEVSGTESVTLLPLNVPPHVHSLNASGAAAGSDKPTGGALLAGQGANDFTAAANLAPMKAGTVSSVGGSQPHENRQPYLVMTWCISMAGIFPSRN